MGYERFLTPLVATCAVVALSTCRSIVVYVTQERAHRGKWKRDLPPATDLMVPSYRQVPLQPRTTNAPVLVRLSAMGCLWIGPLVVVLALPFILFFRRGLRRISATTPDGFSEIAYLVYRLGPLLLARDRLAPAAVELVATLLRIIALTLCGGSLFFVARAQGDQRFIWTLFGIGAVIGVVWGLLTLTRRRWMDAFSPLDEETERVADET